MGENQNACWGDLTSTCSDLTKSPSSSYSLGLGQIAETRKGTATFMTAAGMLQEIENDTVWLQACDVCAHIETKR